MSNAARIRFIVLMLVVAALSILLGGEPWGPI
jgi:hypothetical protein